MSVQVSSPSECQSSATRIFHPVRTVRCEGPAIFRSQFARDVGCLLDIDDQVSEWSCQAVRLECEGQAHLPDFVVVRDGQQLLIDGVSDSDCLPPSWAGNVASAQGFEYQTLSKSEMPVIRLKNGKDLLRYANYDVGLEDRVRLLAALDEHGSLPLVECLSAFQRTPPIAGLASLILLRLVNVDLDEALIGPETIVRRNRG